MFYLDNIMDTIHFVIVTNDLIQIIDGRHVSSTLQRSFENIFKWYPMQ